MKVFWTTTFIVAQKLLSTLVWPSFFLNVAFNNSNMIKSDLRYDMLHHNLVDFISFFNFYLIFFIFHVLDKKKNCAWMELFLFIFVIIIAFYLDNFFDYHKFNVW
jgi:hypothetical protein